jgi:ectoine hydroxylase-related dioxygenase (phytanoyl-CoA dioxygenase family)
MHVDAKHPPGYILGLGALILLDDFTDASGPTRFHPEMVHDQPTLEDFESRALRLVAPAGSVCWFNAGAWHDVLPNRGGAWRRAVLIAMGRAGIRPRFDVPRMLSHLDLDHLPERVCRRLGLLTIPPGSYEEYYLPDGARQEAILRRALDRC